MKLRLSTVGLVIFSQAALFAAPVAFAQEPAAPAGQAVPSLPRQTIQWSRDRLAELDATIAVLERDAAKLQGDARARAEAALKDLRARRDAYQTQADAAVANARIWTDAQVAEARKSLDESWTALQNARDEYLETAKADLATRRAVLEAEFAARQKAWQASLDELRANAGKLAAQQRAAIDARIEALKAQADEAKVRIGRLKDASDEAWTEAKKSYAEAQRRFTDAYVSIRKAIEDAAK